MTRRIHSNEAARGRALWGVLAFATLASGALAPPAAAQDTPDRKLGREIGIMERVLDQMLLDSPNFLVSGRENARGIYVDCYGVIMSFEASLVSTGWNFDFGQWDQFEIEDDGDRIIIYKDKDGNYHKDRNNSDEDEEEDWSDSKGKSSSKLKKQEKLYNRGKTEVLDALLEFGDTLESLRNDQWISIVAHLHSSDYFTHNDITRYIAKIKKGDLLKYTEGDATEEATLAKVIQEEF